MPLDNFKVATTADDILDSYYSIRTDEFIAELAKHEISYHPEVVTIEDEDDESAAGTYQPKTVDYSAEEEGDSRASIDEESEEITEEKDITIVNIVYNIICWGVFICIVLIL